MTSTNTLVVATPADLVSQFGGDITKRAMEVVKSASGGALLVYECYHLVKGRNDFEKQAII